MLKKVYELGQLEDNKIFLDEKWYKVKIGKHCIYIPELEAKIIWSFNGKIEAYKDWDKGRNAESIRNGTFCSSYYGFDQKALESVANEYLLMELLSNTRMSPPVDGVFYIKNFISKYPYGDYWCDPLGRYGYFVKDAGGLEHGNYNIDKFKDLPIIISEGAVGDLEKKKGNFVNGYLVDVRRTIWDMMQLSDAEKIYSLSQEIKYIPDKQKILNFVNKCGQFPFKERTQPYQDYPLQGFTIKGTRKPKHRFGRMGIDRLDRKTLVDLGCCIGSMCFEAHERGAKKITGIDYQKEFIDCGRMIANANGIPINFMTMDLCSPTMVSNYIKNLYKKPVDFVFALSLYKHVGDNIWKVLDEFEWKTCYIESHNAPEGLETEHVKEMMKWISENKGTYLGITEDRSPRCIWRIDR